LAVFVALHRIINEAVPVGVALDDMHQVWQPTPIWQAFLEAGLAYRMGSAE
jgi:hypothetical protein